MAIYIVKPWYKKSGDEKIWVPKTWNGYTSLYGDYIWTDGTEIYYSNGTTQKVLNRATDTWSDKTWRQNVNRDFRGYNVWTDGTDIYCSEISMGSSGYKLNKSVSGWEGFNWDTSGGITRLEGGSVWSDGSHAYLSSGTSQYVFNKYALRWDAKTWYGLTSFNAGKVWMDGTNIYYSSSSDQYVLNTNYSRWDAKTWYGLTSFNGNNIWTDGTDIYYSYNTDHYVLDRSTSTWNAKTWSGLATFFGGRIWNDGNKTYYSNNTDQYELVDA